MNIPEVSGKIKDSVQRVNTREIYTILLMLFVGFSSFGLGRLSKLQESRSPIELSSTSIETASVSAVSISGDPSLRGPLHIEAGGELVASKAGTKYHFPWCSGAQRISEANKIWFKSVEEARKAGYTPASNCKGLK